MSFTEYLELARISHWIKNVFVLPGILIALMMGLPTPENFLYILLLGFISTCSASSANYVINEWLDAPFDQYHPLKKHRPSVTGRVSRVWVYIEYFILSIVGIWLACFINKLFLLNIIWLLLMGIVYNVKPLRTKDIAYADVLSESINNIIRFMLGWSLFTPDYLPSSSILISCWMGGAFLMAVKRLAEYRFISDQSVAELYRRSFRFYSEQKLLVSILFYSMMSLFFLGIFLVKYKIELIISIPFIALLFCWYLSLGYKHNSVAQRPESLYLERGLFIYCLFLLLLMFLLINFQSQFLRHFLSTDLIPVP